MIKRQKPPNKYSLKKIAQINAEAPIRVKLAYRAHGIPIEHVEVYRRNDGTRHTIRRVRCINGRCEKCGEFNHYLDYHEKHSRGRGGVLSMENSIVICRKCHKILQNREPRLSWVK